MSLIRKAFRFFKALSRLLRIKSWGNFTALTEVTKFDSPVNVSWSQCGEDLALMHFLPSKGRYIDVGAHHPSRFSVTRHLYQRGWSGVNIDANPDLINQFNASRKRDVNIWAAIGIEHKYELKIFDDPAVSSVNQNWIKKQLKNGYEIKTSKIVPGMKLSQVYSDYFSEQPCNLLAIDCEGSDFNVLRSLSLEKISPPLRPDWILIESLPPVDQALRSKTVRLVVKFGYTPFLVLAMATLLKKK
jgi:FkbM family methyltransferase